MDQENIELWVQRANLFLEKSKTVLTGVIVVLIVSIVVNNFHQHSKEIQSEVDYLRAVVEKFKNDSCSFQDINQEIREVLSHSKIKMRNLINSEAKKLPNNADQLFDYASENSGARVISYHDTQLMYKCSTLQILMGRCKTVTPPSNALKAGTEPGDAFCFRGSRGAITVRLACNVAIDSITVDHIHKKMAPIEFFAEAPKDFTVTGLANLKDSQGEHITSFVFDPDRMSQTFQVLKSASQKFRYVRVNITSNHGSDTKTCMYRVRVHGFVDKC